VVVSPLIITAEHAEIAEKKRKFPPRGFKPSNLPKIGRFGFPNVGFGLKFLWLLCALCG
jgi:hypothetical protein